MKNKEKNILKEHIEECVFLGVTPKKPNELLKKNSSFKNTENKKCFIEDLDKARFENLLRMSELTKYL